MQETNAVPEEQEKKVRLIRITRTASKIVFAVPVIPSLMVWPMVLLLSRGYMATKPLPAILMLIGVMGYALAYTLSIVFSDKMYEQMRYKDSVLLAFVPMAFIFFSVVGYFSLVQ